MPARRAPRCRGTSANRRRTSASIGPRQTGLHASSAPKPPEVHSRRQRASDLKTSAPRQEPADGQTAGPARSAQAIELRRGPETVSPEGRSRPQTLGGQETQRIAIQVGGRLTSITSAYRQYPPPAKPPGESGASSKGPRHLMGPACVVGSGGHLPTAGGARRRSGPKEPAVCRQSRRASDLKTSACRQNPPAPKAPGGSGRKPRERTAASKEPWRTSDADGDRGAGTTRARRM